MRRTPALGGLLAILAILAAACAGDVPGGGGGGGDGDDGASPGEPDGGPAPGGDDAGAAPLTCAKVSLDAPRPVEIMARSKLAKVIERLPCVTDPWLAGVLESADTMWYDAESIIPGYQDSFGDNVTTPIGMRPNTIQSILIDLAVPGGHAQIFSDRGTFHFPFGRPGGFKPEHGFVVDFWHVPRRDGKLLPVVWWRRQPNGLTNRIEWVFPAGTVLGELLFIVGPEGRWVPFEIRTRRRTVDGWESDAYRPFPTAASLADAIEARRGERPEWASSAELDALVAHLRNPATLVPAKLQATNFASAFPALEGAKDPLPALADPSILEALLLDTPFRSARGVPWKQHGGLTAWAATTDAPFSIVPRGYNAGVLSVDDTTCERCHRDAGRPFKDWYPNILAYGELWGGDESFSWHPFDAASFVDAKGDVVEFNHDNRRMRSDFVGAGLIVKFDPAVHGSDVWRDIPRPWKNYAY